MISVCMATHNGGKYIKQQLQSILNQLEKDDEVIISDDGSTDNTLSIIEELKDPRIKVFHYNQTIKTKHSHEYVCKNFENALIHANGEFIFLSDQDDEWLPEKVDVCLESLDNNDLVLHDFSEIDDNGNMINQLHYNGTFRPRNYLLRRGKHYGCAMAFRRRVLDYAIPFPSHLLLHDYWIGILAETLGSFKYIEKPLIKYRIHEQNTSTTNNSLLYKINYRVRLICRVLARTLQYLMRKEDNNGKTMDVHTKI